MPRFLKLALPTRLWLAFYASGEESNPGRHVQISNSTSGKDN